MPDITMCKGDGCSAESKCYRYLAKPLIWQTWFVTPPGKDETCEHFMPVEIKRSWTGRLPEPEGGKG